MTEPKLTIGFRLVNEFGDEYTMTTKQEVSDVAYDSDLEFIGEQLNVFLKQCGYYRKHDNILMSDLTDDEYCALFEYLAKLRGKDPNEMRV